MRPLISYAGGKQRLAPKLVPLIPKHTVYCEPFAGGAALLFAKPWPKVSNTHHYREVINDTCGDLVNLYRQAQERPDELARLLSVTPYSEAEHNLSRDILNRNVPADALKLAWAYYVNLQTSFANKRGGGWGRGVFGRNFAVTWHRRDIWAPLERLHEVHICNTDALICIKQWDSPHTFFYCDPPYPGTYQAHYGGYGGYTVDHLTALVGALDDCQGALMLSCYDVGIETPHGWQRRDIPTASTAARDATDRGKRTEVIYTRPARGTLRPEIAKLYATGAYDCFAGDGPPRGRMQPRP